MKREERKFYDEVDAKRLYEQHKHENDANYMVFFGGLAAIAIIVLLIYNLSS
mgnify:CR=1 FL=1